MQNIMDEYIKITKKYMNQYMKLILGSKFNKDIFENYLEVYLSTRYYDLNEDKNNTTLKQEILLELEEAKNKLELQMEDKTIEYMYMLFGQLLYFDKVIPNKDIDTVIDTIINLRKEMSLTEDVELRKNINKLFEENVKETDSFLEKFESKEFYVKFSNYKSIKNVYRISLKYNFEFPPLYSMFAIDKAFNTGTTNEDRLFVEYYLTTIRILDDIIKGNFKKQYIVELATSLFEKEQKIERLLSVVENQAIQDKLSFKIKYEEFLENKEKIYELMKRGFRFTVILDNSFKASVEEIERLFIFKFILIDENIDCYTQIMSEADRFKNLIEN